VGVEVARHDMPSGDTVFYRDSDHAYWAGYDEQSGKCSGRVPGISTIAKNSGDTNVDGLLNWAARLTCAGVAEAAGSQLDEGWLSTGETVQGVLERAGATWRQMRDKAGVRGSFSHDVLQSLSEGVTPLLRSGYDHAVIDWWKKRRPEVELVEQVVYSPEEPFAGRFDLMALVQGQRVLLDLKTSKWASNSFAVQLNLYRIAAIRSGFVTPQRLQRLMILQVREDGSWTELYVPTRPDWALAALQTYRHGAEIRKALAAARKEAQAVAA
jgi:hypothetical protein